MIHLSISCTKQETSVRHTASDCFDTLATRLLQSPPQPTHPPHHQHQHHHTNLHLPVLIAFSTRAQKKGRSSAPYCAAGKRHQSGVQYAELSHSRIGSRTASASTSPSVSLNSVARSSVAACLAASRPLAGRLPRADQAKNCWLARLMAEIIL